MKKIRGLLLGALIIGSFFLWKTPYCQAAENANINITVPTNIQVVFEKDGTNTMDDFVVQNQSLVPVSITNLTIRTYNEWELVSQKAAIRVDTKKLAMTIEGKEMFVGDNVLNLPIREGSSRKLALSIQRGAWNEAHTSEKALEIELSYTHGKKAFQVALDGNGSDNGVAPITANNGDTITLPNPTKIKHAFKGWADENGNVYQGNYVVPIGGAKLTAQWVYTKAYGFYSADDKSLNFVRSETPIVVGDRINGKKVTRVFSDFEDRIFTSYSQTPWWGISEYESIAKVEVQDVIQPKGTAYWFFCMRGCGYYDLQNINASKLEDMSAMFSKAGEYITDKVQVLGMGNWDVSNVKTLDATFRGLGENAKQFYMDDLSGWNTANVTSMSQTFHTIGKTAAWKVDCSKWNVDKVTNHSMFAYQVENNIVPPKWVY